MWTRNRYNRPQPHSHDFCILVGGGFKFWHLGESVLRGYGRNSPISSVFPNCTDILYRHTPTASQGIPGPTTVRVSMNKKLSLIKYRPCWPQNERERGSLELEIMADIYKYRRQFSLSRDFAGRTIFLLFFFFNK